MGGTSGGIALTTFVFTKAELLSPAVGFPVVTGSPSTAGGGHAKTGVTANKGSGKGPGLGLLSFSQRQILKESGGAEDNKLEA